MASPPAHDAVLIVALLTGALGFLSPALQDWPKEWQITTEPSGPT